MPTIILTLLSNLKNWKVNFVVLMAAIILYQNFSNTRWFIWADTIPYLQERVTELELSLDIAEQGNKALTAAIEDRNAEIVSLGLVTKQLEIQRQGLQADINELAQAGNAKVTVVEKEIIDQSCTGAMEYMFDSIPELNYTQ